MDNNRTHIARDRETPRLVNEINKHNIKQRQHGEITEYNVASATALFGKNSVMSMVGGKIDTGVTQASVENFLSFTAPVIPHEWSTDRVLDFPYAKEDCYVNYVAWSKSGLMAAVIKNGLYFISNIDPKLPNRHNVEEIEGVVDDAHNFRFLEFHPRGLLLCSPDMKLMDLETRKMTKLVYYTCNSHKNTGITWDEKNPDTIYHSSGMELIHHDIRCKRSVTNVQDAEEQVVTLRYNSKKNIVAGGSKLGKLLVWDIRNLKSTLHRNDPVEANITVGIHTSMNKAMVWSRTNSNMLVTGSGIHDRRIRVWDFSGSEPRETKSIDTQQQLTGVVQLYNNPNLFAFSSRLSSTAGLLIFDASRSKFYQLDSAKPAAEIHQSPDGNMLATVGEEQLMFVAKTKHCDTKKKERGILHQIR